MPGTKEVPHEGQMLPVDAQMKSSAWPGLFRATETSIHKKPTNVGRIVLERQARQFNSGTVA